MYRYMKRLMISDSVFEKRWLEICCEAESIRNLEHFNGVVFVNCHSVAQLSAVFCETPFDLVSQTL